MTRRFCPNLEIIKDEWKLTNFLNENDPYDHHYYSIKIIKCNPADSIECLGESAIEKLLKYLVFTLNKTTTVIDYKIAQK